MRKATGGGVYLGSRHKPKSRWYTFAITYKYVRGIPTEILKKKKKNQTQNEKKSFKTKKGKGIH